MSTQPLSDTDVRRYDVVVVGAGFAGIYMLHRLRGLGLSARVLEAASGVGGTWFWNRYPGARCDVQSFDYSYSFSPELQQEWQWSERYATQPEILNYLEHVVERFDLGDDIQLDTRVASATFDEQASRWTLETEAGEAFSGRWVVMATGCLSVPNLPQIPGLDSFQGQWCHSGMWPAEGIDLAGKRVGLIGTGSTGIQLTIAVAKQAGELFVFQRSPNFSLPAQNRPLDDDFVRDLKASYDERRRQARTSTRGYPAPTGLLAQVPALSVSSEERRAVFERAWANGGPLFTSTFPDLLLSKEANDTAADFVREKIGELVHDPVAAELLKPLDHPLGTRRPCVDTGYYETFNRENVTLVDARSAPIEAITPTGLRTTNASYDLDVILFALGFDAMTGALRNIDIKGVSGRSLREVWADGPASYLGVAVEGFPNLFTITGPGSPSVLTNMVMSIEQHVGWLIDLLQHAQEQGVTRIEAEAAAQADWVRHVADRADQTLFPVANSWWTGANIPGKPRVFMPYVAGLGAYTEICNDIAGKGYPGLALSH